MWSEMYESDLVMRMEGLGKNNTIKHDLQVRHTTLFGAVAHQAASLIRCSIIFSLSGT